MAFICLVLYFTSRRTSEKRLVHSRIFRALILTVFCLLILESLTWILDGSPDGLPFTLEYAVTMALFLLTPLPAVLWALYINRQIFHDITSLRKEAILHAIPFSVCAVLTLTNPFTQWMFFFDASNVYARGPVYMLLAVVSLLPILFSLLSVLFNRKRVSRKFFFLLLLFMVPPIAGAIAQITFYGLTVIWSSITISLLIAQTNLQSDQVYLDHLTGIFNRRQLDIYLADRIRLAKNGHPLSCIMLDINHFKSVNDTLGHVIGDEALKDAANILKSSIRKGDILSRYGGDEFVILTDIKSDAVLQNLLTRIRAQAEQFNATQQKPYSLSFSAGFAIYDPKSGWSMERYLEHVDALMYQDKTGAQHAAPTH